MMYRIAICVLCTGLIGCGSSQAEPQPEPQGLIIPSPSPPQPPTTVIDPREYAYDPSRGIIVRVDPHVDFEPLSPR